MILSFSAKKMQQTCKKFIFNEEDELKLLMLLTNFPYHNVDLKDHIPRNEQPSVELRQEVVRNLANVFYNWYAIDKKYAKGYYLKLWVFKNDFRSSQVVISRDRAKYDSLFNGDDVITIPLPEELAEQKNFIWQQKKYIREYSEEDINEIYVNKLEDLQALIDSGKARVISDKFHNKQYLIHEDDVWLGSIG